jgi:hypothetical protein
LALSCGWIALVAVGLAVACGWVWRLRRENLGSMTKLGLAHLAVMGLGVALMGVTLAPVSTLRDDIRPFAREILGHTGEAPALVLYKLEPRMWPFYLGMTCREVADLDELPAQAQWVMVKAEDIEIRRKEMARRYGALVKEVPIQEPVTGNAGGDGQRYVLMEFAGR